MWANLGPLGLLVRDQPTVRQGIEAWIQNRKVHTDFVSLQIEEGGGGSAVISLAAFIETPAPKRQVVEMPVAVLIERCASFSEMGGGRESALRTARHAIAIPSGERSAEAPRSTAISTE